MITRVDALLMHKDKEVASPATPDLPSEFFFAFAPSTAAPSLLFPQIGFPSNEPLYPGTSFS